MTTTMPSLTRAELNQLRHWRTIICSVGAVLQGIRYMAQPAIPLHTRDYEQLRGLGMHGWQILGAGIAAFGFALAVVDQRAPRRAWMLFAAGGFFYSTLFVATIAAGVIPTLIVIPVGLFVGELRAHVWQQDRAHRGDR